MQSRSKTILTASTVTEDNIVFCEGIFWEMDDLYLIAYTRLFENEVATNYIFLFYPPFSKHIK